MTTLKTLAGVTILAIMVLMASPSGAQTPAQDHSGHQPPAEDQPAAPPPPSGATITDADRQAAFPDVHGHTLHDSQFRTFILAEQLEWQQGNVDGANWDVNGWLGYDRDRLWVRSEGESAENSLERGDVHALYGRAFVRWWDVVAGVRQDVRPGAAQTWGAIGLQGLAPYWFEVQATAYIGADWRTQFRLETQYEFFLTNRVTLQPLLELRVNGKADPERGLGAGLSSADYGLRLRYIVRREVAPYIGLTWNRVFSGTADLARLAGAAPTGARVVVGLRMWM